MPEDPIETFFQNILVRDLAAIRPAHLLWPSCICFGTQTVFIALLLSHKYYSFALLWPGWEEWKTLEDFLSGFQGQFSSVEENCYDCGIVHVLEHITWTRLHTSTLG